MTIITALSYILVSVSAGELLTRQQSNVNFASGGEGAGIAGSIEPFGDQSTQILEHAGRTPNKTGSASFNFFPNEQWTWNVNITDVAVPYEYFNTSDLHVVNTQWDLRWPGGGSLQSYMDRSGRNDTLCLSATHIMLPSNVTKHYTAPGNCSDVLGSECAANLLASFSCIVPPSTAISESLKGCEDTLVGLGNAGTLALDYLFGRGDQNTTISGNTTVYFKTSRAVTAANLTDVYDQAQSRLNLLMLKDESDTSAATMLCQIIDPKASSGAHILSGGCLFWTMLAVSWLSILM